ncbi:hypothetical protein [Nocardioides sp. AE5]|uniref:hypothetical protein n=1 Tax=Nocardioides sp. AE5 TaxID=2962573 RepID=UPI00288110B2|nr:hypothetical protein [Nocardioides sp. AE5]MDT0202997.1 hypothetical protein [Nocardioides sp. AE5]
MSETTCRCAAGTRGVPPWRQRDTPASPASFLCGVLVLALAAALLTVPRQEAATVVGLGLVAVTVLLGLIAAVVAFRAGHRRTGCVVAHGLWGGVAWLGLPVRIVFSIPF